MMDSIVVHLNLARMLLCSKAFLSEVANYPDLFFYLTKLMMSQSPTIAILAASVLKVAVQHHSGNEGKLEQTNKKILVRGPEYGPKSPNLPNSLVEYLKYHGALLK